MFGASVAMNERIMAVGVPEVNGRGEGAFGTAILYEKVESDSPEDVPWKEVAQLSAPHRQQNDHFGLAVAVSDRDDTVIVGAPAANGAARASGAAYVFQRRGMRWVCVNRLVASGGATGDSFGFAVAVSGGHALVGTPKTSDEGNGGPGLAYIFACEGDRWLQEAELTAPGRAGPADLFGRSVSIDGDRLVVGSPGDGPAGAPVGSAYVFARSETGQWLHEATLAPSELQPGDGFGFAVSIRDDRAAVASINQGEHGERAGAVYLFRWNGKEWRQEARLVAHDHQPDARFGSSLDLDSARLAIGSFGSRQNGIRSGAVYLFSFDERWTLERKLSVMDEAHLSLGGLAVAMNSGTVAMGAPTFGWPADAAGRVFLWCD